MKKERFAILLSYLDKQTEIVNKLLDEIKIVQPTGKESISHLGYLLHNLYCAFEDLFQEIAKTFENYIEDISKFHRELLKRMSLDIQGIRPKVLSQKSYFVLDELRGFRHIFRHSYDYELTPDRLNELKKNIIDNWQYIKEDIEDFRKFLLT